MTGYGPDDDLRGARFEAADLSGARFERCDLSGVVMRGVEVRNLDVDRRWLGEPYHPFGQTIPESADDGVDLSLFVTEPPPFAEVLRVRAGRVQMVREYLATVSPDDLAQQRRNPWAPQQQRTVLSCLHTILAEEWEHHRYAVRDLDAIASVA